MTTRILTGDCRDVLTTLPERSVQMCVTSPPYFGLRDYGVDGQIGLEASVEDYVSALVSVFREVRQVLRDDGTAWVNLGDSYNSGTQMNHHSSGLGEDAIRYSEGARGDWPGHRAKIVGIKHKDLIGIPWRVAFALQADGWYLRQDIIWHKPNPMPESVRDRCTKAHEYIFLLSKSPRYYYDASAIAEESFTAGKIPGGNRKVDGSRHDAGRDMTIPVAEVRNKRSVWTVATQPFSEAHFATFPPKLIEPCILAGSREGDTVLDPFGGAGTTALVADRLGRHSILTELNPEYAEIARKRIHGDAPLFADVAMG